MAAIISYTGPPSQRASPVFYIVRMTLGLLPAAGVFKGDEERKRAS